MIEEKMEAGQHVKEAYMPYAMSTIIDRALPDVRDGLKPVHRRILSQMHKAKISYDKDRAKSMDGISETMKIHHHGDASVYDAIALLTEQNETLLHPYIDGEGSFGKVYSKDKPAKPRYTYLRLNSFSEEFFKDMDKGIIKMVGEDKDHMQPLTLSSAFPNILIKNNEGIACGEACNFPSFNMIEVNNFTKAYIKDKNSVISDYIKGFDFSTGGQLIYDEKELNKVYNTGKGSIKIKGTYVFNEKENIIEITSIPYNTTVETIIEEIIKLVKTDSNFKNIIDVTDGTGFNQELQKETMSIDIQVKKNTDIEQLMNKLFLKTSLENKFSVNMNCLVNCEPKVLGIKPILDEWLKFRRSCIKKSLKIDLKKSEKDLAYLLALQKILLDTDKCISIIKNSDSDKTIVSDLCGFFEIDELQASEIANMKLRNINKNYIIEKIKPINKIKEKVDNLKYKISTDNEIDNIIIQELDRINKQYGKPRLTEIIYEDTTSNIKNIDMIEDTPYRIAYTSTYIKKHQKKSDSHNIKEGEVILGDIEATNKSTLLIFTDKANRYKIPVYELETYTPSKLGDYVYNILPIDKSEQIIKIVSIKEPKGNIYFTYENGNVAKIDILSFMSNNKKLQNCYSTESKLLDIYYSEKEIDIFMLSSEGQGVIISSNSFNSKKSRKSNGDIGIKLTEDNKVIGCILNVTDEYSLKLTAKDYKTKEIYFDDVYSKDDDTQLYKKLKGKGNRNRQGLMIWNMRNYKNNNSIIKCEII